MRFVLEVAREAIVTARAQPVASAVSILIVAGMVAAVLLTTGRTVGSEQAVLDSIDSAGTRTIVVRAEGSAGLDATVLNRLEAVEGIETAIAFGPVEDVSNVAVPGSSKVPARLTWAIGHDALGLPESPVPNHSAWASERALRILGLTDAAGGIGNDAGTEYAVVGKLNVPAYLEFLGPLIVVPQDEVTLAALDVAVLVVVAERPDLIAPLTRVVSSVLGVEDPTKVQLETSEELANLRALVQGQLGTFGRSLTLVIFGLTSVLVAVILYGLVMLRRKDFGRRRALGASQRLIVALLLTQTTIVGVIGSVGGTILATIGLAAASDPLPSWSFVASVNILAVAVAVLAATFPALAAARRDPLTELRVP